MSLAVGEIKTVWSGSWPLFLQRPGGFMSEGHSPSCSPGWGPEGDAGKGMSQGWGWGPAAGDVSHGGVGALPGGQVGGSGAGRGLPGQDWESPWIGESSRHPNLPQKGKATFPRKRVRHAVLLGGLGRSLAGKSPAALRVEPKGGVTRGTLLLVPQDSRAGFCSTVRARGLGNPPSTPS